MTFNAEFMQIAFVNSRIFFLAFFVDYSSIICFSLALHRNKQEKRSEIFMLQNEELMLLKISFNHNKTQLSKTKTKNKNKNKTKGKKITPIQIHRIRNIPLLIAGLLNRLVKCLITLEPKKKGKLNFVSEKMEHRETKYWRKTIIKNQKNKNKNKKKEISVTIIT